MILLALSPLFFAQTTLVHLDLTAALFTTLAVYFLLREKVWLFALAASLAVLSKETAVVLLPVAWLYAGHESRASATGKPASIGTWVALAVPLAPLAGWTLYYHHATGFLTGNREYLSYNLYSTLSATRMFWSLLRRGDELFLSIQLASSRLRGGGLLVDTRAHPARSRRPRKLGSGAALHVFGGGTGISYLLLLSVVGGAILPRYLLPILPFFYLLAVALVMHLPRFPARVICLAGTLCFVGAWFINPPYPFPF